MNGLEQFKSVRQDIEDSMFDDSKTRDIYENAIKQRLIKQYGMVKTVNGGAVYQPNYSLNDALTAGVILNDDNYGNISDELIVAKNNEHAYSIVQQFRDDAYSTTSSGTPSYLTTVWTNKFYEVITRKTVFEEISHSFQQGTWGITNIKIPFISYASNYALYTDFGVQGDSSANVNWMDRQVVNFERPIIYGDLAVAQMSLGKIDLIGRLREATMRQIKLHQDAIGFFGYSANMNIYGLLNDPSLAPTIVAGNKLNGAGLSTPTLWQYGSYFEIIADIIALRQSITNRAGGNDEDDELCYLLLPPSVWNYLLTTSPMGNMTVKDWIEQNYKNMRLIKAPLLQGTGTPIGSSTPNYAVLIFDKIDNQECLLNAFVTLYNSHGVIRQASSYQEKISYSLGGAIVSNAIGIQIMRGI